MSIGQRVFLAAVVEGSQNCFSQGKNFSALLSSFLVVTVTRRPKDSSADIQIFLPTGEEQEHYLL